MSENLKDYYSHTSRTWNSAVTITMAAIALSIAVMFTQQFTSLSIVIRVFLAIAFYLGIVVFGFYRIVEMGCQIQFLETQLTVNGKTLLEYVSGEDGKSGKVPRMAWFFKRMSLADAKALEGKKIGFSRFAKQHFLEVVLLAIFYAITLYAPSIPH